MGQDVDHLKEASFNIDLENVETFLRSLVGDIEKGFDQKQISKVNKMIVKMKVDEEKEKKFPITFQGNKTQLIIGVFKDDYEEIDLHFYTDPKLANIIDNKILSFCERMGM